MVSCSVITDDLFSLHDLPHHPENQRRLNGALSGVPGSVTRYPASPATTEDLCRIHDPGYLRWLRRTCEGLTAPRMLDADTYITPDSYRVAGAAAGSAISAMEKGLEGENCFALIRPPGHHAERGWALGFCLLNNIAIAAARALDSVDRVAIVDWDQHHGNGTQHAFFRDGRVLYCSSHAAPFFPGTGYIDEIGEGPGTGCVINAPLEYGSDIADVYRVFSGVFLPALERFRPDLCLVSAGQDVLSDDPLGVMSLHPEGIGLLTALLRTLDIPLTLVLEGGYGPSHGRAVSEIFRALRGKERYLPPEGPVRDHTREVVEALRTLHHLDGSAEAS